VSGSLRSEELGYKYELDGLDEDGERIPDVPIVYLVLETNLATARGPAILDTGFDGGIYPNFQVVRILRGMKPVKLKRLDHPLYGPVSCEVFRVNASLTDPKLEKSVYIGEVNVYTPMEPEFLSQEVLLGREVLNKLKIELNGTWTLIRL